MVKKKGTKRYNFQKAITAKQASVTASKTSEVTAPAFGSLHQPVFLKVCRLCETKDGPFLNIFDADKVTTKKIEAVMPFRIEENDDLPHKICFRCSAKLEELYEFIQKCIRTQDRLQTALGKKGRLLKVKHRELWEEKLNQSNISNDDICDALIKKAMEGIKDIPLNFTQLEDDCDIKNNVLKTFHADDKHDDSQKIDGKPKANDKKNTSLKMTKTYGFSLLKNSNSSNDSTESPLSRSLRSCTETKLESESQVIKSKEANRNSKQDKKVKKPINNTLEENKNIKEKEILQTNTFSLNESTPKPEPVFNIMDHISTIKVNGVGVLFQCKLCNRNFLKKQVVMSHACAKNGGLKVEGPKPLIQPELPKVSTVKYINTKVEVKKTNDEVSKPAVVVKPIDLDDDEDAPLAVKKPKPRIGPASRVRRNNDADEPASTPSQVTVIPFVNTSTTEPIIEFPKLPSLNSRYKLMAGPNNTYTLVEEKNDNPSEKQLKPQADLQKNKCLNIWPKPLENTSTEQMVQSESRPYPVGLFKTVPHNSGMSVPLHREPVAFTTPAMKKQSYTVVQTGNPSKLLISSKPQIPEEVPKKRIRKTKYEVKKDDSNKQPFSVTLEDTAPPRDAGFFTFINVDPLLQPSYVLPTDNIIQESQISTSTNVSKQNMEKDCELKYTCNMCSEKFTREKKLLTHIQSHYSKMDEEDQIRTEKTLRKRRR